MAVQEQNVVVPDIGTDDAVEVIEINVNIGDEVQEEDTLITLESEKASMEIPSPSGGVVSGIVVKVGDKVSEGSDILTIKLSAESGDSVKYNMESDVISTLDNKPNNTIQDTQTTQAIETTIEQISVTIPDIGTDDKVDVIEVLVNSGDVVSAEDSLLTLESEKASMDIPAPTAGIVKDIKVKAGDKVATGDFILYLESKSEPDNSSSKNEPEQTDEKQSSTNASVNKPTASKTSIRKQDISASVASSVSSNNKSIYASPSIRRFANDLGVDLSKVVGTGRKARLLKSDIEQYVKTELSKTQSGQVGSTISNSHFNVASLSEVDFSKFGEVSEKPLSRIKKLSASNLHRNWVMVPHVTQFDEADISDMEAFRQNHKKQAEAKGYKLTPLVFLMKAAAQALKLLPQFNVSLTNDGSSLIQKHFYHIGIAVDTPNGLVVPVIRDVDQKGLFQLAQELAEVSAKARDGKLTAKDMQGGCFTISSLGGIGGTAFTPIVNVPDVAILGVSKSQMKPIYKNGEFVPRLMLPLSLSYDHRAIDGADAARFITLYSRLLHDISQLLL